MTLLPGTRYLIDTSALARMRDQPVFNTVEAIIDAGMACTCVTVDLEVGYSARGAEDMEKIRINRRELFDELILTSKAAARALQVQMLLATRGLHRAAGPIDLLTAAVAEEHRVTVLHYDADFEHIASVTGQQHQWIVPRGSLP